MELKNYFPTTIAHFNDTNFTDRVLNFINPLLETGTFDEKQWGYKTSYASYDTALKLYNEIWIKDYIMDRCQEYLDATAQKYLTDTDMYLFISDMKEGEQHCDHAHPMSMLSGVCYLEIGEDSAPIAFHDHREIRHFSGLVKPKPNPYNQSDVQLHPKRGDIVIWESWLKHSVPVNNSKTRKTLVFNISPLPSNEHRNTSH